MEEFIKLVKTTNFYKEIVLELYVCKETPDILWFRPIVEYTKRDEVGLWADIRETEYDLQDVTFAPENLKMEKV